MSLTTSGSPLQGTWEWRAASYRNSRASCRWSSGCECGICSCTRSSRPCVDWPVRRNRSGQGRGPTEGESRASSEEIARTYGRNGGSTVSRWYSKITRRILRMAIWKMGFWARRRCLLPVSNRRRAKRANWALDNHLRRGEFSVCREKLAD